MEEVVIYSDGACSVEEKRGGFGTILVHKPSGVEKEISEGYSNTTNNRMELLAVIRGLEALKRPCKVLVVTDSKYIVDAVEKGWLKSWLSKPDFAKKKNEDLWRRFEEVRGTHSLSFKWVKGHEGHVMNERCDKLAVAAKSNGDLIYDARD